MKEQQPKNTGQHGVEATENGSYLTPFIVTLAIALGIGLVLWYTKEAPRYENAAALDRTSFTEAQQRIVDSYVKHVFFEDYERRLRRVTAGSDGRHGTRAAVRSIDGYGTFWQLMVDPDDMFKRDRLRNRSSFIDTLVHELGHVVLLNDHQIDYYSPSTPLGSCGRREIVLESGCVRAQAYLNGFIRKFWTLDEVRASEAARRDNTAHTAARKRYRGRADEFVTPYAATSPIEDSAEAFTHFILMDYDDRNNVAADKVRYFYAFDELKALRQQIRANLEWD